MRALTRGPTLPRGPAGGELVRVGRGQGESQAGKGGLRGHGPLEAPLQFLVRCLWPQDGELMGEETKEAGAACCNLD